MHVLKGDRGSVLDEQGPPTPLGRRVPTVTVCVVTPTAASSARLALNVRLHAEDIVQRLSGGAWGFGQGAPRAKRWLLAAATQQAHQEAAARNVARGEEIGGHDGPQPAKVHGAPSALVLRIGQ